MRRIVVAWVCALAMSGASALTVQVTGHITNTGYAPEEPETAATFQVGDYYTLTYEWIGPGAPLAAPVGSTVSWYPNAGSSLLLATDGYQIAAGVVGYALSGQAGIYSRVNISSRWYQFSNSPETPLTFTAELDGRFPYYVGIELNDPTGTSLPTLELTGPSFDLAGFPERQLEIAFARTISPASANEVIRVFGTVESMTVLTPVPEPSTAALALLGIGLVAAAVRGAARTRTA